MTDTSSAAETLALVPPNIFGGILNVKSEDPSVGDPVLGAPLRLTEKGHLEVIVDAPFPAADKLTLYLNGRRIDVPYEVDAQDRTRFRVPKALLREGAQNLQYEAERGSGNSEKSPELWVLYSLIRPGGRDPFGGNDYQDNLKIGLPEAIIKLGVGPEEAAQDIPLTVSYPFAKLHDVVEVNCNGYTFTYTVTQNDLGGSFDIPIPEEAFIEGGNSESFLVSYTVWDQLENYTQDGLPSIALSIVVDLKPKEMDRPDLIEDMAGEEDDADTIDRSSLKDFLFARVHVRTPLWKKGDSIRLTYTCIPAEGAPVTRTLADVLVNRVPDFVEMKMPAAQVIAVAWVRVDYSLVRSGKVVASSYLTKAEVVGGGSSELPAPLVPGLVGKSIDPTKHPDGFTVRVDWATGWKTGDKVKLVVTGGASGVGTPVFGFILFNVNSRANFKLNRDFIMANANLEVGFKWVLLRDGKETESKLLPLTIERINAENPNFPSAEITQAIEINGSKVVDLRSFKGDAQVVCPVWPFIAALQRYWLQVEGTGFDGERKVSIIVDGLKLTPAQVESGLDHVLPRSELEQFKPGHQLTVRLRVDLYPNENAETIVTFIPVLYTLITAGMYDTLEFVNSPYTVAPLGRLKNIELKVVDANGEFIKQKSISVIIPKGFTFSDGGEGRREFKTGIFGEIIISGVKAPDAPQASYSLQAELDGQPVVAALNVTARGKLGELASNRLTRDVVISPDGTRIYAADTHSGLLVIDSQTLQVIGTAITESHGPLVTVSPDGGRAFVCYGITIVNLMASERLARISSTYTAGKGVFSLDGVHAYFVGSSGLVMINTALMREEEVFSVGGFSYEDFIAISPSSKNVFVCEINTAKLSIFDPRKKVIFRTSSVFQGRVGGFAMSSDGRVLYVSYSGEKRIRVFNAETLSVSHVLEALLGGGAIALGSDGRLLFVASTDESIVRVVDTVSLKVVRILDVAGKPRHIFISPDDARLYVCYSDLAKMSSIQIR